MRFIKKYKLYDAIFVPFICSPLNAFLLIILKIGEGISPVIQMIITANFINNIYQISQNLNVDIDLYFSILQLVFILGYSWLSSKILKFSTVKLENDLRIKLKPAFLVYFSNLEYSIVEDKDNFDLFNRIYKSIERKFTQNYILVIDFTSLIIRNILILFVIFKYSELAAILFIILSFPLIIVSRWGGENVYKASVEANKLKSQHEYYSTLLTSRESANERVMFNYSGKINQKWELIFKKYVALELESEKLFFIRYQLTGIFVTLISFVTIVLIIPSLTNKGITLGLFISLANSIVALVRTTNSGINRGVSGISIILGFFKDISKFSELEITAEDITLKEKIVDFNKIEISNLKFKYPKNDTYILNGINMEIDKGKHYAIVGENGSGKTTLIKILLGLYKNYEGSILIDGVELSKVDASELFSVLFQDYSRYNLSFLDNITVGNNEEITGEFNSNILNVIELLGLNKLLQKLENSLNTKLGEKIDDGVDVSIGEWQKIAIARLMLRKTPIKILDEPTASIDPISESNIYKNFDQLNKESTAIFISHRLGSTKLADIIYVFKDGKIIEKGSHDKLIRIKSGFYSEMYSSQKGWYTF